MSVREIGQRLALLKALTDAAKTATERAKIELGEDVGWSRLSALAVRLPDETEGATLSLVVEDEGSPAVIDDRAFLAWVKKHRPSAVIETVRDSDRKDILAQCATTGELPDGVGWSDPKDPYIVVRQTKAQRENTIRAWRERGDLALPDLTEPGEVEA